jgi:hypothetical protein
LLNGPIAGLLEYAIDDRLLDLWAKFRERPEISPPRCYRAGEVLHKMLNSALELRNTIVSLSDATAVSAMAKPTVALSQLSLAQVILTQKLPGMVAPLELAINYSARTGRG